MKCKSIYREGELWSGEVSSDFMERMNPRGKNMKKKKNKKNTVKEERNFTTP